MGGRINFVNDIQILQEMLVGRAQVRLQQRHNRLSVELTDLQAGTTVEIKGLPPDRSVSQHLRQRNNILFDNLFRVIVVCTRNQLQSFR